MAAWKFFPSVQVLRDHGSDVSYTLTPMSCVDVVGGESLYPFFLFQSNYSEVTFGTSSLGGSVSHAQMSFFLKVAFASEGDNVEVLSFSTTCLEGSLATRVH